MKEKVLPNSPTLQPIVMGSHSDRSLRLLVTLHLSSKSRRQKILGAQRTFSFSFSSEASS